MWRAWRRGRRRLNRQGQLAAGFIVIMGLILVMVSMTVNLGQMAQVRVEVSNASDAAALAAASWMASGQNEAALIAQKMWATIDMINAIYQVPFCNNGGSIAYADFLWMQAATMNLYLHESANLILVASWNIGRREAFTAMVNNLMMRNAQTTAPGFDPFLGIYPVVGSVLDSITWRQETLLAGTNGDDFAFTWNNYGADPASTTNPLIHSVDYDIDGYPSGPAQMPNITSTRAQFRVYDDPDPADPEYDCSFLGEGILFGPINPFDPMSSALRPAGGMDDMTTLGAYPVKRWNFPVDDYIPNLATMTFTTCTTHCGIRRRDTLSMPVLPPGSLIGGFGVINTRVEHRVTTPGPVASLFPFPVWEPRFEPVEATTQAMFQPATMGVAPAPTATARITDTD